MAIDLSTLFIIAGIVEIYLGCIFICTYRTNKIYHGLSYTSASFLARGVAYILLLIGLNYKNLYLILIANILIILSLDLIFKSMRMYIDVKSRGHYSRYIIYVTSLISYSYYLFIDFNTDNRIIILRFCAAIISAYICYFAYKYMPAGFYRERDNILLVFGLTALICIVTGGQKYFIRGNQYHFLQSHMDQIWGYITLICLSITTAIAFLNFNNRCLKLDNEVAKDKVNALSGLIRICSCCKKIRDNNDNWLQIEKYIAEHTKAIFTHGFCPECFKKEIIKIDEYKQQAMSQSDTSS